MTILVQQTPNALKTHVQPAELQPLDCADAHDTINLGLPCDLTGSQIPRQPVHAFLLLQCDSV